jgi:iron complex outermembrane receptor protein
MMNARNDGISEVTLLGRATSIAVLCGLLMATAPAFSQSATDQTTTDQTGAATGALQEVVVTAERRATDVQTTPISVVAVSGEQLQSEQIKNIQSLQQEVPNLTITQVGANEQVNIRGVGLEAAGGNGQNGVILVHDGLPNATTGAGVSAPYFDIADVEVLRGPQGTFTGVNSIGGALIVNSANPTFTGVNGYVDAEVGTYSDTKFQGAVNLPASDTVALRFAFNEEQRGSFFYNEGAAIYGTNLGGTHLLPGTTGGSNATLIDPGNVDNKNVRFSLLWKPTDNFQSLTKFEIDADDSQGLPAQPITNSFGEPPGIPCPAGQGTAPHCHNIYYPGYSGSPYVLNNWDTNLLENQNFDLYSEELRFTLPNGIVLRSMGGIQLLYLHQNSDNSNDSINYGSTDTVDATHIYTEEVDLISPTTGKFTWITGASLAYAGFEVGPSFGINSGPPFSAAAPSYSETDEEYYIQHQEGAFGQITWQFTPTLQLLAGIRFSWDSSPAHPGGFETINPPPYTSTSTHSMSTGIDEGVPTGKIGLNWTPLPGQYFYAFFARGYKPREDNAGAIAPSLKESVRDYEGGWKGRLADGHVLTQLDVYYQQYDDIIDSLFNPNNVTATFEKNIPTSIVKGIEASMQAQAAGFSLSLSAALNKSILGPLIDAPTYEFPSTYGKTNQCAPGQTPNAANSNCTSYTPYLETLSGESLPYAPLFSAHASIQYTIPLGSMSLQPRVVYAYQDKSYSQLFQIDNYYLLPGHSLWSGYLDWNAGRWTTSLYGTNLANTVYLNGPGYYSDPRQYGLELHATF